MKIESGFSVIASVTSVDDEKEKNIYKIHFSLEDAEKFLFRTSGAILEIDNMKILFKYDIPNMCVGAVFLLDSGRKWLITNHKQIFNDVKEGYIKLLALEKIGDIIDFDFGAVE